MTILLYLYFSVALILCDSNKHGEKYQFWWILLTIFQIFFFFFFYVCAVLDWDVKTFLKHCQLEIEAARWY